jgi:hypothetical protein
LSGGVYPSTHVVNYNATFRLELKFKIKWLSLIYARTFWFRETALCS